MPSSKRAATVGDVRRIVIQVAVLILLLVVGLHYKGQFDDRQDRIDQCERTNVVRGEFHDFLGDAVALRERDQLLAQQAGHEAEAQSSAVGVEAFQRRIERLEHGQDVDPRTAEVRCQEANPEPFPLDVASGADTDSASQDY